MAQNLDLASLFGAVVGNLQENQEALNQADDYNHNHGDNMVEVFQVITEAMETKRGADPADQLAYASELLRQRTNSGSAAMYADGLSQASQEFQGSPITANNAMTLVQSLLGGPQPQAPQAPQASQASGDLLGSLLSGLTGGPEPADQEGLDMGDLLSAGMSFLNAKQQGGSNLDSLVSAMVSTTQAGQTSHRAESGAIVANTLLQMLGSMGDL